MTGNNDTRVWIDGEEVEFVAWTLRELIYTRPDFEDTLIRLPQRTVQRMLRKGTLRIEGARPEWANPDAGDEA
ncbi:MAG: hypothetical protein JXQ72_00170 [Anaerolineae bacterium]|nr:hypothetical protein [Anaerolineae bacterium]